MERSRWPSYSGVLNRANSRLPSGGDNIGPLYCPSNQGAIRLNMLLVDTKSDNGACMRVPKRLLSIFVSLQLRAVLAAPIRAVYLCNFPLGQLA